MNSTINDLVSKYLPRIKEIRRVIHQNPELGHEEYQTQQLVQNELDKLGIENYKLANTGVVGLIHGSKPGKTILLRADMDALPVTEMTDLIFKSSIEGKMHACGHDGHTAGLLGAAMILSDIKDSFNGCIKLMFQPAEETDGGALPMIEEGLLDNPKVDAAIGLHLGGDIEYGKLAFKEGSMMGAPDEFEIEIIGKGGHAAHPNQTIDPISIAVQFISNAQNILTRRIDPIKPAVISFTTINAGSGLNVIPETCKIGGTIRTLHNDIRREIPILLENTLRSVCDLHGASYDLNYMPSYPPLINDKYMTDLAVACSKEYFGSSEIIIQEFPTLGAEDFAYLGQYVPATYYYVGIMENNTPAIHHHPTFAWNDDVLHICSTSLVNIALAYLKQ